MNTKGPADGRCEKAAEMNGVELSFMIPLFVSIGFIALLLDAIVLS